MQPGLMAKLQEEKTNKDNRVEKITGISKDNLILDNILDKKLAKHGLTQKDLANGR